MAHRVAFHTLGCKLNFAETSTIKRQFEGQQFDITSFEDLADIYVINTCSVTQDANRDCRKMVRRALKQNPNAFVAVVGCYAQLEPEEIAQIDGVDLVLGARDKFRLLDVVEAFEKNDQTVIFSSDVNEAVEFHHAFSSNDRTRAFLKIQDGCDFKCSFCTIPLARGDSRSPRISTIVENAKTVIDQGYNEIVLTGVNAGDFGKGTDENFLQLLLALEELSGLKRIRISSVEPNLLSEEIIGLAATSTKIQPHFHIPLQSGSDDMLRLMRRRYKTDLYQKRVELIKELMPHACIGADVITGHPGESETHFKATFDFIDSLPLSYLHVFTYSERPNTKALSFKPVIPKIERKRRTHILRRLSAKKRFSFDTSFHKQTREVLFESKQDDGMINGWTDNYIRVKVPYVSELENAIQPCELFHLDVDGVYVGELLNSFVKR